MIMRTRLSGVLLCALCLGVTANVLADEARPPPPVWKTLRPFRSVAEFDDYRHRVRDAAKKRGLWWASMKLSRRGHPLLAQVQAQAPGATPCDPDDPDCGAAEALEEVSVTGMRASRNTQNSITNNQEAGVDEGDIVKAYDRYFVVLQHGRLFSVDTGAAPGQLRLVDRINAYQSASIDSWIDEILIFGDTLLVTGYSYDVDASIISMIRIDDTGMFHFLARYFIESNDYFSGENYASRIVDGKLVIYTPVDLTSLDEDDALPLPRIRRWTPDAGYSDWQPLFGIRDVYRPIQATFSPAMHVLSVCPVATAGNFGCRARGIVGPWEHEVYVAPSHAYLWLSSGEDDVPWYDDRQPCSRNVDPRTLRSIPSAAFRLDIARGSLTAVRTEGVPSNQFAFDDRGSHLWALVKRPPMECSIDYDDIVVDADTEDLVPMALARIPASAFSTSPPSIRAEDLYNVPAVANGWLQAQYAGDYLLYGTPQGAWAAYYGGRYGQSYHPGRLAVVPLPMPDSGRIMKLGHSIDRIELFGRHALVFGYPDVDDFAVSSISLRQVARVADTEVLPGVAEAEGRSHAFNGVAAADDAGLFGIPTVKLASIRDRRRWETPSDITFVSSDAQLNLTAAAALAGRREREYNANGYTCEVSCYDWYGNARPIFYRDRIFGLTGQELIEGTFTGGRVAELARVNLTDTPANGH
jgi:hypothetical protein